MPRIIPLLLLFLTALAMAKSAPQLAERAKAAAENCTLRLLAPEEGQPLPEEQEIPLVVEAACPPDAAYQSIDLDFHDVSAFDCDEPAVPESRTEPDGRRVTQLRYLLTPVQPPYEIPAVTATFKDAQGDDVTVTTEPFALEIATGELSEEIDDSYLEPAAPPRRPLRDLAWIGGLLLFALLLAGSLWRTLRRRAEKAPPPLTPYEIAERDLNALLAEKLPETGEYKLFYQRISGILRSYLENRFEVQAPKLTTEEFLRLLAATPELIHEHRDLLRKFLTACDLVKFAEQVPGTSEIAEITSSCRNFLNATAPAPHSVEVSQEKS